MRQNRRASPFQEYSVPEPLHAPFFVCLTEVLDKRSLCPISATVEFAGTSRQQSAMRKYAVHRGVKDMDPPARATHKVTNGRTGNLSE
jgi:hypothetical protein